VIRTRPHLAAAIVIATAIAGVSAAPDARPDWFSGTAPLQLRLEAPLDDLFGHAQQDGYSVRGSLTRTDGGDPRRIDPVTVSVRGHTSRRESECSFPKLKLTWDGAAIKIGTHCGEADGNAVTAKFGRLPNQMSPVREAFVYQLLDRLGVPTLRARAAEITYVSTNGTSDPPTPLLRHAFLLEDDHGAMHRLGAVHSISETQFATAHEAFTPEDTATIAFGEALVGNFDWCLRFFKGDTYRCDGRHPLWNLLAFRWEDGRMRPVMYDFDVSGAVAGYHRWFGDIFNEQFLPSKSHAAIEVIAQLAHARTLFDRGVLDATRRAFASKRDAAYDALATSAVDAAGKHAMTAYFDAFFEAMANDAAFYRPVVVAADTRAYADANRSQPVCNSIGALPVGTPVSAPIDIRGDMVQVVVLDAMWKFAPPAECPVIHDRPVWIAKAAVSTQYPSRSP
jgi:hypothetical protein